MQAGHRLSSSGRVSITGCRDSFSDASPHAWYDQHYDLPPGTVGADPEDVDDMIARLRKRFDPEAKAAALKTFALRNKGPLGAKKAVPLRGGEAVEIMTKVFDEGHQLQSLQKTELATLKVLKNGLRDYIDYSLDEVDRFVRADKNGQVSGFTWRVQGNAGDIPVLRRSKGENGVQPEVIQALLASKQKLTRMGSFTKCGASEKTADFFRSAVIGDQALRNKRPELERFSEV